MLVHYDFKNRKATLSLRAFDLLAELNKKESEDPGLVNYFVAFFKSLFFFLQKIIL